MVSINLGDRLRQLRHKRKLSLYDVERKTGLHFSTVGRYERNEREPSIIILRELANVYDVTVSDLLAEDMTFLGHTQELDEVLQWLQQNQALMGLLRSAKDLNSAQLDALSGFLDLLQLSDLSKD